MRSILRAATCAALLAGLTGCGGGGGGEAQTEVLPAPAAQATPTSLQGKATYDHVPNVAGVLRYELTEVRAIRGAVVEVVDVSTRQVLATTRTDDSGAYLAQVDAGRDVVVRVKAQLAPPDGSAGGWDVQVRDNTRGDALYALESESFNSAAGGRDLHAGSGWTGNSYGAPRAAAPFAILASIAKAQELIRSVAPGAQFPALSVFWSSNNRPGQGDLALGEIGISHFARSGGKYAIYLLGKEDADTDEYDDSVVVHEWGHYYQSVFSRNDSFGGDHGGNAPLEMALAFSEGWGNAWQGLALGRNDYADSYGPQQGKAGVLMPLRVGPSTGQGWYSEESVAHVLWSLGTLAGVADIHQAMVELKNAPAFTGIHAFAAALRSRSPQTADLLDPLLTAQNIVASARSDYFGAGETNDYGLGQALPKDPSVFGMPLYLQIPLDRDVVVCGTSVFGPRNRLGVQRALRFDPPWPGSYQITVTAATIGGRPLVSLLMNGERKLWTALTGTFTLGGPFFAQPLAFSVTDSQTSAGTALVGCATVKIVQQQAGQARSKFN